MNLKKILLYLRDIVLFGILSTLIAFLIASLISYMFDKNTITIMYWIGMSVAVLGALSLGQRAPVLMGTVDFSNPGGQYMNHGKSDRAERQMAKYYDSIKIRGLSYYRKGGVNLFANGIIIFLLTYLFQQIA